MTTTFKLRIVMISEANLEPNDTQSGGQSGRTITIQLTRDMIMLIAALLFLGIAILIAVVFPLGSPGSSALAGTGTAEQGTAHAIGGEATAAATDPARATADAAYPAPTPAAGTAALATPEGSFIPDAQGGYPAPTANPPANNGDFSEQRLTMTPDDELPTDEPTGLPIFDPTRTGATATANGQPSAYPGPQTPIPTFPQPTVAQPTSAGLPATPTDPVFGGPATETPDLAPTPTFRPQPTRAPAAPPTPRPPTAVPAPTAVPVDVLRGTVRWTRAQSPILVARDQQLVPGATLIIEAGVEVRILPGVSFYSEGTIYALGQPGSPVRIVGATPQRWGGIFGRPGANITMEYTEIRGGGLGSPVLVSEGGNLTLHHAQIKENGGQVLVNNSRLEVRDSEMAGNDIPFGSAIEANYSSGNGVIMTNNRIGGNRMAPRTAPVRIGTTSSVDTINLELRGNLLVGETGPDLILAHEGAYTGGIDPNAVAGPPPFLGALTCNTLVGGTNGLSVRTETQQVPRLPLEIHDNAIEKHTPPIIPIYLKYGIGRGATSEVQLDMRNNWWGNAAGPYEPDRHADGRGEAVGDMVEFGPWLTERPACAPQQ